MDKATVQKAKESGRANRKSDMTYFTAFYLQNLAGGTLKALKMLSDIPWKIQQMFDGAENEKKIQMFITNHRRNKHK